MHPGALFSQLNERRMELTLIVVKVQGERSLLVITPIFLETRSLSQYLSRLPVDDKFIPINLGFSLWFAVHHIAKLRLSTK